MQREPNTISQDSSKDTQKKEKIKIENVLGDLFGFRRGKERRNAIGMLKITSERNLDIDLELYREKAFDSINRTTLMHILMETSIDRREIKLMSKHGSEC